MRRIFVVSDILLLAFALSCNSPERARQPEENQSEHPVPELDSLNRLISKDSTNASAFYARSVYYLEKVEVNAALADINKAIQNDDRNPDYYVTLGDIYLSMNRIPNCLEALLKALDLDPVHNDALLKISEVYLILKDYENTFRYTGIALDNDRINPVAHFIRGYAYMEMGDTALAVKNFQAAADMKQDYYEAYVQLGILYSIAKDPLAAGYFQTATRIAPNRREAHYLLGMTYQEQENIPKALETYSNLLAIAPDDMEVLYNIGYIHLVYTADYPAAIDYFSRAIALDPKYTDAWFNRGYSYELAGDYVNARKDYQKALEITPNYERSIEGLNRLDNIPQ